MSCVKAKPGESIENLLKRFKKAVEYSGILSDFRKNERYEKPSVRKRRKQMAARKKAIRDKKKLERFQKPKQSNWKWNKDHTKKIPLKSYSSNTKRGKFTSKNTNKSNSRSDRPKFTNKIDKRF